MILCVQLDKLGAQLETLSSLIDRYQRRDLRFEEAALKWLEQAEQTMSQLRLPEGAEMSSLRGRILKVEDEFRSGESRPKRSAVRRARNAAAADALDRAEEVLRHRVLAAEDRLRTFEDKLAEGMTAFLVENHLPENNRGHTAWLNVIWRRLKENSATRPLSIYLSAALAATDRNYILHRVLERVMDEDPEPFPPESPQSPQSLEPPEAIASEPVPPSPAGHDVIEIEGIGPATREKLAAAGIATTDNLLRVCASPEGRREVSAATGYSTSQVLTWANVADLMRISGIGPHFARVLEAAGVDTVKELRTRNPENLCAKIAELICEKNLGTDIPAPSQVTEWIEEAKDTEPIITY